MATAASAAGRSEDEKIGEDLPQPSPARRARAMGAARQEPSLGPALPAEHTAAVRRGLQPRPACRARARGQCVGALALASPCLLPALPSSGLWKSCQLRGGAQRLRSRPRGEAQWLRSDIGKHA